MPAGSHIQALFGKYAKSGYVDEEGFILAVISLLGFPPTQGLLEELKFAEGRILTYREFVDAMTNLHRQAQNMEPSLEEVMSAVHAIFSKDSLTLAEFISGIRHRATLLDIVDIPDELLVGLYQYAGGLEGLTVEQFACFIHRHAGAWNQSNL